MNSFAAALKNFQQGTFSREELEEMIDRDIGLGTVAADDLLLLLQAHHNTSPLDPDDFDVIRRWISRAETRQRTQIGAQPSQTTQPDPDETILKPGEETQIGVGSVINNRFELEALIGSGGMSQVFKAVDRRKVEARSRDPYVAIKVMDVRGIAADQAFVAMQREVQKSQSLTHQHIVRVNDFDRDGDIVYTTMELLEGESLQQRIARSHIDNIPIEEAVRIVHEMGAALECAHENNIIHADFKPSNVFLANHKRVKVIDFGIARAIRREDYTGGDQTVFDARELGAMTPAYASPEMIEDLEPHPRDDIYALGCVTYELITGMHPYSRLMATEARDRNHPLARPKELSKQQWAALEQTLHFDPFKRTSSVRAFLDAFTHGDGGSKTPLMVVVGTASAALLAVVGFFFIPSSETPSPIPDIQEVVQTPSSQAAGETFSDCATCPTMSVIAAGTAEIGMEKTDLPGMFEYPKFEVSIPQNFAISAHEVTVGQFREFAEQVGLEGEDCRSADNRSGQAAQLSWRSPGFAQSNAHPVTCVSWQDANQYTTWLSEKTGETYRLPSETEWEYTARVAAGLTANIDTKEVCNQANVADATAATVFGNVAVVGCTDGFAYTAPVTRNGETNAPADLRGNVFEWTLDCWNSSYEGAPTDGTARVSGSCDTRVLRGGSWFSPPEAQRITFRNRFPTDYRSNTFGFRIVRTI